MRKSSEYPFWLKLIALPFTWSMMILKLLIIIPIIIVAKCNEIENKIKI